MVLTKEEEKVYNDYVRENRIKFPLNPRQLMKLSFIVMNIIETDPKMKEWIAKQLQDYADINLPTY